MTCLGLPPPMGVSGVAGQGSSPIRTQTRDFEPDPDQTRDRPPKLRLGGVRTQCFLTMTTLVPLILLQMKDIIKEADILVIWVEHVRGYSSSSKQKKTLKVLEVNKEGKVIPSASDSTGYRELQREKCVDRDRPGNGVKGLDISHISVGIDHCEGYEVSTSRGSGDDEYESNTNPKVTLDHIVSRKAASGRGVDVREGHVQVVFIKDSKVGELRLQYGGWCSLIVFKYNRGVVATRDLPTKGGCQDRFLLSTRVTTRTIDPLRSRGPRVLAGPRAIYQYSVCVRGHETYCLGIWIYDAREEDEAVGLGQYSGRKTDDDEREAGKLLGPGVPPRTTRVVHSENFNSQTFQLAGSVTRLFHTVRSVDVWENEQQIKSAIYPGRYQIEVRTNSTSSSAIPRILCNPGLVIFTKAENNPEITGGAQSGPYSDAERTRLANVPSVPVANEMGSTSDSTAVALPVLPVVIVTCKGKSASTGIA
ncbi:hypothetical protein C8R44DRAFT_751691 [Mycena epipterygia]|nr:hypothetical protein C8R44DRAFT_751691 [Mycena epipterygia]